MNNRGIGYVYIASNPSYQENLVKIGSSNKPNIRMKQLYSTGVPEPFSIVYLLRCYDNTHEKVEKEIHDKFDSCRTNPRREFFFLPRRQMEELREVLEDQDGDLVDEEASPIDEEIADVSQDGGDDFWTLFEQTKAEMLAKEDDDLFWALFEQPKAERQATGHDFWTLFEQAKAKRLAKQKDNVDDFRALFEQAKAKRLAKAERLAKQDDAEMILGS